VAELIYGENAEDNFDSAVRIVILILIFVFDPLAVLLLIAANISLRQWKMKRQIAKTEKQYTLEQRLEKEKKKSERFKEKSRDYKKMVAQFEDFKDMDADEIKLKLDQIYDWNDKS
jgi:Mg2+/Co2+ transporter CorB